MIRKLSVQLHKTTIQRHNFLGLGNVYFILIEKHFSFKNNGILKQPSATLINVTRNIFSKYICDIDGE